MALKAAFSPERGVAQGVVITSSRENIFFSETTMVDKNVVMTMTRYPRLVKIASALCRTCRDDHPINEPSHLHLMICSMSGYANGTAEHSCLCCCFLLMVLVATMSAVVGVGHARGCVCMMLACFCHVDAAKIASAHSHRGRSMVMKPLKSHAEWIIREDKTRTGKMLLYWAGYSVSMQHAC